MATDTNLTNFIVNSLTREQNRTANKTGHENELFVQKDHAGVYIGANGVDGLDTTNISNCITEIPQDIKLELNNGTLTLKAGSKVYVPNGASVFDTITTSSDISVTSSLGATKILVCYFNSTLLIRPFSNCTSGAGATATSGFAYDTTTNKINYYNSTGTLVHSGCSLPICIATSESNGITSIDQVFNGFGYIGLTMFALPGVKGLIPDGRNADGSLKNIERTVTSVITDTRTINGGNFIINITGPSGFDNGYNNFISSEIFPTSGYWICYKPSENKLYNIINGVNMGQKNWLVCGNIERDTSSPFKVLSMKTKTAFHALDYNDSEYIAHQAMPSNRYVDLTLGTSGSTYTAPADGYMYFTCSKSDTSILAFRNSTTNLSCLSQQGSGYIGLVMIVSKGDIIKIEYGSSTNRLLRFVYAEGSK